MQKMTSAYANKMLRSLEEDKNYWVNKEETSYIYTASINEEPVIPEYDYAETAAVIDEIDKKIMAIRHAVNAANASASIKVGEKEMSVDMILIRMAQLNRRKNFLDRMRKQLPKVRVQQSSFGSRNAVPEYRYINYDLALVKSEYERISKEIMEMQMALDIYNQTVQFEADI